MKTPRCLLLAALVLAGVLAAGCQPAERCYFCVVPARLPDGGSSEAACRRLEAWFCRQAGGFTRIPGVRGGWMDGDRRVDEENVGYLVAGPPHLQAGIEDLIRREFDQAEPFVVYWATQRKPPPDRDTAGPFR
jgi:hypothetical protein